RRPPGFDLTGGLGDGARQLRAGYARGGRPPTNSDRDAPVTREPPGHPGACGKLCRMANPQPRSGTGARRPGPDRLLRGIRDLLERGRIDVAHLRIGNLIGWLLARGRSTEAHASLTEAC